MAVERVDVAVVPGDAALALLMLEPANSSAQRPSERNTAVEERRVGHEVLNLRRRSTLSRSPFPESRQRRLALLDPAELSQRASAAVRRLLTPSPRRADTALMESLGRSPVR